MDNYKERLINLKGNMRELSLYVSNKTTEFQRLAETELSKGNIDKAQEYHVQHLAYMDIWHKLLKENELNID